MDVDDRLSAILISRAPNTRKSNGRVNCEETVGPGASATVSPFHKDFRSQIEDGVYPFIEVLLEKNYFPISSCEGHPKEGNGDYFEIILAIPSKELAEKVKDFIKIKGCEIDIYDHVYQQNQYNIKFLDTDVNKYKIVQDKNIEKEFDFREINILYKRKYSFYTFLTISIFKEGFDSLNFKNCLKILERKIFFSYTKKKLLNLIKDKKFPESIY